MSSVWPSVGLCLLLVLLPCVFDLSVRCRVLAVLFLRMTMCYFCIFVVAAAVWMLLLCAVCLLCACYVSVGSATYCYTVCMSLSLVTRNTPVCVMCQLVCLLRLCRVGSILYCYASAACLCAHCYHTTAVCICCASVRYEDGDI